MTTATDSRAVGSPTLPLPSAVIEPLASTSETQSEPIVRLKVGDRVANLIGISLPFLILIGAVVHLWGWGIGWTEVALFFVMYVVTGMGVTVGYHRYFTHRSFETGPVIKALLGVAGSMAVEGAILRWVAFHRCHHQHSDAEHDPHSPHGHGHGFRGVVKGAWNAHVGWMLRASDAELDRYIVDLQKDRMVRVLSSLFPLWMVLSFVIPGVIGGLVAMSWEGFLLGVVWGGFVRVFFVHHVTWSVNSVCHLWGTKAFKSHDESRNNVVVGVLGFGEGWHNNHHAFPASARHGLKWWQIDTSWLLISASEKLGLVWKVRVPSAERLAAKAVQRNA
jgi:stearoyl-CoA desaturase (delta-9 desaturase)